MPLVVVNWSNSAAMNIIVKWGNGVVCFMVLE